MSITIQKQKKEGFFSLKTTHTEYQMKVDHLGVLQHLWYGTITGMDMGYLLSYPDVGFSGNPEGAGDDRTYSLDTLPLEYPCDGTGDYRLTALSVQAQSGTRAADLRFVGYEIKKGKYSIPGLPASYGEGAETLEITMRDNELGLTSILKYGVFESLDIITRSVTFLNEGDKTFTLEQACSLCLDLPRADWEWIHFPGRHTMERQTERVPLFHGIQESSSVRGTSSHQQNPAVLLCRPDCTETAGECMGFLLMYSGSFQIQIELDQLSQTRLTMGLHPDLFSWQMKPGGRFDAPEAVLCYSDQGFETLSHRYHRFIQNHICRGKFQFSRRPVLINNWEATYFSFDEERICAIAKDAALLGVELLVLDDGWFGKRDDDNSGLGDWIENREKLPHGLAGLADRLKNMGLKLGLWFEPECVSEDSDLYRKHPDWVLRIPNRQFVRGRNQLVLDLSRKEVEDYLFDSISKVLHGADISYVKWDMNRSICDWYSTKLSSECMGELPHRYVLGLYSLLERLTSTFPDVLFEGCSGGGGRFDAGMLYYTPQIWCSDNTDAYERTKIQYGTSFFYPVCTVGSHVSAVPNHQTGRITPLESRAVAAMAGSFGYELDLRHLTDEEREAVKAQIVSYKNRQTLIHGGTYYRLSDPLHNDYAAWEFVSANQSQALIQGIIFRTAPNSLHPIWKPRGLNPTKHYRLEQTNQLYTGAALMHGGVLLPDTWGDYFPIEIMLTEV